jgi:hypothetical protein
MNKPTNAAIAAATEFQSPSDEPRHENVWCALAAAQAEFSAPKKGSVNPAFKSKYADLNAVVEAVAPGLSRHGIAFYHLPAPVDLGSGPQMCMVTTLHHGASDTRMDCPIPLIVDKGNMQGFKSAATYAKRIGLESVTGVAPDDDDGNDAAKAAPLVRLEPRRDPETPAFNGQAAAKRIADRLAKADSTDTLAGVWKGEAENLAQIKAVDPEQFTHLSAIKDKRKQDLAPILADEMPY